MGKPLKGNKIRLLDENGKEVPDGEPGILYLRGPHSPAGYWRDPVATREVFDDNNWTTTGDIVTLEDGRIWIMGRQKDMIIRGGQNIYPAEIEGLLNEHPRVSCNFDRGDARQGIRREMLRLCGAQDWGDLQLR